MSSRTPLHRPQHGVGQTDEHPHVKTPWIARRRRPGPRVGDRAEASNRGSHCRCRYGTFLRRVRARLRSRSGTVRELAAHPGQREGHDLDRRREARRAASTTFQSSTITMKRRGGDGDRLLAEQRPAAALRERQVRGDLVGPVDRDVDVAAHEGHHRHPQLARTASRSRPRSRSPSSSVPAATRSPTRWTAQ